MNFNKVFKIYKVVMLSLPLCGVLSCSDKLDEMPDNRTQIDSKEKVAQLLTSAYPSASPAVICELSGDNLVDNNVTISLARKDAYSIYNAEAYRWEDMRSYSTGDADAPNNIWESYYMGIATCNHAIEAMSKMSSDPAKDADLAPYWGEAHVLRAYCHFVLVSLFAESYQSDANNQKNMGIPYVTKREETVYVDYSTSEYLHNIKETYAFIQKDIEEGVLLINDAAYSVPAYHFNVNAANAFAARFYLFTRQYQKAKDYADKALSNSSARNWKSISTNTIASMLNDYNDEKLACNYMLQSTYSTLLRMIGSIRYAINEGNSQYGTSSTYDIIYGGGPCWNNQLPAFSGKLLVAGSQEWGALLFRVYEYFEYADKIAGYGMVHTVYQPFTYEETLLVRAEANLFLKNQAAAVSDLDAWAKSLQASTDLTQTRISNFYSDRDDNIYCSPLHLTEMGVENLTGDDLAILDCVLHFRRVQTAYQGDRWFDIKRYGIDVHHAYREPSARVVSQDDLKWNDKRRVLQIPVEVSNAYIPYPQHDRTTTSEGDFKVKK